MSLQLRTLIAIRDSEGLTPQEKLVLWTMYSRGAEHTASIPKLAHNMGYKNHRQTQRTVNSLRDKGILMTKFRDGTSSVIAINVKNLEKLVPTHDVQDMGTTHDVQDTPVVQVMGGMTPTTGEGCRTSHTKDNSKKNEKENTEASAGAAALSVDSTKDRTRKMTDSIIAEKREQAVVKSGEKNGTHDVQDMGTPEAPVDYAEKARVDGVAFYYDKHMAIQGMKPKSAYLLAMKMAGKGGKK